MFTRKKIGRIVICLFLLLIAFIAISPLKKAYAQYYEYEGMFTNNNNVDWQVGAFYHYSLIDSEGPTYTFWVPKGTVGRQLGSAGYAPQSGDWVKWWNDCVDPQVFVYVTSVTDVTGSGGYVRIAKFPIDISCHTVGRGPGCASGQYEAGYAACNNLYAAGQTLYLTTMCPQTGTTHFCAVNGSIYGVPGTDCAIPCNTSSSCTGICHKRGGNVCTTSPACVSSTWTDNSCTAGCAPPPTPTPKPTPPGTPILISETTSCSGVTPMVGSLRWTNGANTTSSTLYYCDKTVADPYGGCVPDNGSIDSHRWYRLLTDPFTLIPGHDYLWLVADANAYGHTNSATRQFTAPTCDVVPIGYHDGATCSVINGWTCDQNNYNLPLSVHFYDGPGFVTMIGATTANVTREPAVGANCGGNSAHGFSFNTPASVKDSSSHAIYAYPINIDSNGNPTGNNPPLSGTPKTLGPCYYNVTANVYVDYNGNGVQDINGQGGYAGPTEPPYTNNATISYSGGTSTGSPKTFSGGTTTIPNITANQTENITLNTASLPSGWKLTTTNPVSAFGPPATTVNFGIQPPAPICGTGNTGNLTATQPTINLGQTSALNINCTIGGGTGTLNYTWSPIVKDPNSPGSPASLGNVNNPNITQALNTNTYSAPAAGSTFKQFIVDAAVTACNPGVNPGPGAIAANLCTSKTVAITVNPLFSAKGVVFTDINKNTTQDAGENNYSGMTVNVCPGQYCATPVPQVNGAFDTGYVLTTGNYNVTASGLPTGYFFTTPGTLRPTVGNPCSPSNGACDANYNVNNLHFGISNSRTWTQSTGGDIYESGGVNNPMPIPGTVPAACGGTSANMSINQGQVQQPGIIFTGNGSNDFGQGYPSANLNNHWLVSQAINLTSTSYASANQAIKDAGVTPTVWSCNVSACVLPTTPGVYTIGQSTDTVKITANTTFPNTAGAITFLIPGKLEIGGNIIAPIGVVPTFIVQGNIVVDGNVGETIGSFTSSTSDVDGYYSTDGNFIINGTNDCISGADKRLNMSGAIVVNAAGTSGGSAQVKRDMCAGDVCPTFSITARPDFVLYAPSYLQSASGLWKEIAP